MKIRTFGIAAAALIASILPSRAAHAGCIETCDAVTKITATLMNQPSCVTVTAEPDNGCVCYGSARVTNNCSFELTAKDFTWSDGQAAIPAGEWKLLNRMGEVEGLGDHHDELSIEGNGQTFTLVLDYTVAHIDRDFGGGCAAGGSGAGGAGAGIVLAAGASLLASRRARRQRKA